ncbi:Protein MAIN-LIKE 2 [Linum perenne]
MSNYGWDEPLVDQTPEGARPQPGDCSLLWGENKHRATLVWRDPHACKALKLRQRSSCLEWSSEYETFLRECRLLPVVRLLGFTPCKELVTALIERWRPETNTFHLIPGEATITLEDVEVLTGLPIDGVPVTVTVDRRDPGVVCEELLGARPLAWSCTGQPVKISWVKGMFDRLQAGASADVVLRYARAYTWVLLGAILLADRTGDLIPVHLLRLIGDSAVASTFSWGSAVLAWLYKAMGRAAFFTAGSQRGTGDLGGFTLLVQLWALERFPIIADRYVAGGDPPEADTVPRGVRWMSVIRRHQHRVAMKLEEIRYAFDRNTEFVVRNLNLMYILSMIFLILPYNIFINSPVDVVRLPRGGLSVGGRCVLACCLPHAMHRLCCMAPSRSLHASVRTRSAYPTGRRACSSRRGVAWTRLQSASP